VFWKCCGVLGLYNTIFDVSYSSVLWGVGGLGRVLEGLGMVVGLAVILVRFSVFRILLFWVLWVLYVWFDVVRIFGCVSFVVCGAEYLVVLGY